jgi:hypothetical protein
MFRRRKKGQSTLEYAILIAVVVAALLGMQTYFKRGVSARAKSSADDVGGGELFSPGHTQSDYTTESKSWTTERQDEGVSRTTIHNDAQRNYTLKSGSQEVDEFEEEDWDSTLEGFGS